MSFWDRYDPPRFFLHLFAFILELVLILAFVLNVEAIKNAPAIMLIMPVGIGVYELCRGIVKYDW